MKRLLLVKSSYKELKVKGLTQPLGIMYLSSYIKSKSRDYQIKIFDNRFYNDFRELEKVIREFSPDIAGISAITQEASDMHHIASIIKKYNKDTVIIAGGPHPTQFFEDVLSDSNINFVIRGEGEEAFYELIERVRKGVEVGNIQGVAYKVDGKVVDGGKALLEIDINELSMPDYGAIDMRRYFNYFSMATIGKRRYAAISTSRGCPFGCIFCHNLFGRKFRYRSPELVMEEIDYLVNRYRITDLEFVEDIFNLNRSRTEKILDMLIERNYKLKLAFPNGLRTDMLDKELLSKFKQAGTIFISFAIETASVEQQKKIKKRLDIDRAREIIDYASGLGILCNGFFMLGFPGETREEIQQTIDFALKSRLHTAYFFIVNPFKGTELYDTNKDLIEKMPCSNRYQEYNYFLGRFNLSRLSTAELLNLQRDAYMKFYLRPERMFRILNAYINLPRGLRFLIYYALKTIHLVGYKTIEGIFHDEDPSYKTENAPR